MFSFNFFYNYKPEHVFILDKTLFAQALAIAPHLSLGGLLGWYMNISWDVATLALGSRPKQGLVKVQAKNETQESHFMLAGV
jgi:hypothetical protein